MNKEEELIDRLIDLAFAEDIGDGDHTTLSCIPATAMGKSKLLIKEPGILAGIEIAKEVFHRFDPTMKVEVFINDGTAVKPGDVAMIVEGKIQSLLQTERLMLNIMQRMSGIATMTHKYAEQLKGTNTRVLDTRKTTPGMRILEKMAVKIGGGVNHRIGLFDMILLKDNHVDFAGGIDKAITALPQVRPVRGDLRIDGELFLFAGITGRRFWPQSNLSLRVRRDGQTLQDDFSHEQCLVVSQDGHRVLVSGCAHNGILNILDRYRDLFGGDPDVVISGFHMMKKQPYDCEELDVIDETARELARHNTVFYTGHCTGLPAFERMQTILGEQLRPLHSGVELDLATR
jgi:nicotinate-nucleotide pyrophosphorylase (carboxylating)